MAALRCLLLLVLTTAGCALTPDRPVANTNALLIRTASFDGMWERTVSVLHRNHFMIARESKLEGVIETEYRDGSNLLELWHPDSVGVEQRTESCALSIRRKVIISFSQSGVDQMLITVIAQKEIEDVPGPTATYEGGATFSESSLLERDLDQVTGQAGPSRWLPRGRDIALEHSLTAQIRSGR